MKAISRFLLLSFALAVNVYAQYPPTTLYNDAIHLSSIGRAYHYDNGNFVWDNSYLRDPSEATNKVGVIPNHVYRMYSGFQNDHNSISTTSAGSKAVATEFTITYSGPASNQTVQIKIGTTAYSSTDGGDAWSGVSGYSISKSVSGSSSISLSVAELETVSGWLQNGTTIYFGAIINNEQTDASIFQITNVLIKYKKVYTITVTVDRTYDQSSVLSLNGTQVVGSPVPVKFDEGTVVYANALTVVTQSTTNKYVFSNIVLSGVSYNTPTPSFPAITADKDLSVTYAEAVKAILKTLVTYNSFTDADIPNAPMDVYKDGALYLSAITPVE